MTLVRWVVWTTSLEYEKKRGQIGFLTHFKWPRGRKTLQLYLFIYFWLLLGSTLYTFVCKLFSVCEFSRAIIVFFVATRKAETEFTVCNHCSWSFCHFVWGFVSLETRGKKNSDFSLVSRLSTSSSCSCLWRLFWHCSLDIQQLFLELDTTTSRALWVTVVKPNC